MIFITPSIAIDENEIQMDFIRSSGPGGQNVNKVSTAAQLRFDVIKSTSLPDAVRERLNKLARNRITKDGILVIDARRHRTQEANRQDAINRLIELIRQASQEPIIRHKTQPTLASKKRRLESKHRRSETKQLRRNTDGDVV